MRRLFGFRGKLALLILSAAGALSIPDAASARTRGECEPRCVADTSCGVVNYCLQTCPERPHMGCATNLGCDIGQVMQTCEYET